MEEEKEEEEEEKQKYKYYSGVKMFGMCGELKR